MIPIKYKPKFRQGEEGKVDRNCQEPPDQLRGAFEKYLERSNYEEDADQENYEKARENLENLEINIEEVHSLIDAVDVKLPPQVGEIKHRSLLGNFLTAAYNLSDQKIIDYELEKDERLNVGNFLEENKTLFLNSDTDYAGLRSKGTIINLADSNSLCPESKGVCVNDKSTNLFHENGFGFAINLGKADKAGVIHSNSILINFGSLDRIEVFNDYEGYILSPNKSAEEKIIDWDEFGNRHPDFSDVVMDWISSLKGKLGYDSKNFRIDSEEIDQNEPLKEYLNSLREEIECSIKAREEILSKSSLSRAENVKKKIDELAGDFN